MQQQAAGREGGRTGGLAGDVEDKRRGVKVEKRVGYLELLLRADATATTTLPSSLRRPISRGVHLFVTVSIGRKV